MAQENVAKFMELIRTDEALQAKFKAAAEAYEGPKGDEKAVFDAVIAPLAAEVGLPVTYEEGLAYATAERELSDEELDAVAGGDSDGVCYYVGWANDGPDVLVCDGALSGLVAPCIWVGITIA